MIRVLGTIVAAAIVAASSFAAGPAPTTIVQTDKTWVCNKAVDLDAVTVTMTPKATGSADARDAVHLEPGCTGTIGKLDVTTSVADGVKVAGGVHDLMIEGGSIRCLAKRPILHQDGIQVLGGDRITLTNMHVDCGRPAESLINSNMFINMAGRASTPPTDVVCDMCTFGGGAAHTVSIQNSIRSGVEDSTLCRAKYANLTLTIGSLAVDPVNSGNKLIDCAGSGGGGSGGGGSGATKISLKAQLSAITFGHSVVLTGSFKSGRSVTLYAQPYGAPAFTPVSTLRTDSRGGWKLTVHPRIGTSYRAVSRTAKSPTIAVGVRPVVKLSASHGRVVVRVIAKTSFKGRAVLVQKLRGTRWVTWSRLVLGKTVVSMPNTPGVRLRAVVPAGHGYLQAVSPTLTVR
jgi:hypothetical protein